MSVERFGGLRVRVAAEAARLMYEEGVKQYFTAKRIAAKRVVREPAGRLDGVRGCTHFRRHGLFGRSGGKKLRYRPADLPSNGEIRDALLALAELAEGSRRRDRLFAMRITALETMRSLGPFEPRLIGSVSTGHVRRGSDVDIQVFTDDADALIAHVRALGWVHETERVCIQKGGAIREYLHVHVADVFAIELTVYPRLDLRSRPRSSTDGKSIVRNSVRDVEALLASEHAASWDRYCEDGSVDGMDSVLEALDAEEAGEVPGPYDGFVADGARVVDDGAD